jgi:hypothetical protein
MKLYKKPRPTDKVCFEAGNLALMNLPTPRGRGADPTANKGCSITNRQCPVLGVPKDAVGGCRQGGASVMRRYAPAKWY